MARFFIAFCLLLAFLDPAVADRRVALIIANSEYINASKLTNPHNDAQAVAKVLTKVGFATEDVTVKFDLSYDEMRKALMAFGRAAEEADVAIIYFAGHGYGSGVNYLVPVDAELKHFRELPSETISQRTLEDSVKPAKRIKLVILDACRNDPSRGGMTDAPRTRGITRGLEQVEPEAGVLVAYSAKHGTVALDGPAGGLSPFAQALVGRFTEAKDIRFVFGGIRDDVMKTTKNEQEPWFYHSLGAKEIFLVTSGPSQNAAAEKKEPSPAAHLDDKQAFSKPSGDPDSYHPDMATLDEHKDKRSLCEPGGIEQERALQDRLPASCQQERLQVSGGLSFDNQKAETTASHAWRLEAVTKYGERFADPEFIACKRVLCTQGSLAGSSVAPYLVSPAPQI